MKVCNPDLDYLLNSGDMVSKRSLMFYWEDTIIAYTTEYLMNSELGPLKFWVTWMDIDCRDYTLLECASITVYPARARLYFPAYLDTRIPPENREDLEAIMKRFGLTHYDKFDFIIATTGSSPIKRGLVKEIEPVDCPYEFIHAMDEIVAEYKRKL